MAFCTNCGTPPEDGSKFCAHCGVKAGRITTAAVRKTAFFRLGFKTKRDLKRALLFVLFLSPVSFAGIMSPLFAAGTLDSSPTSKPPTHYIFVNEDGSDNWDGFYNYLRENAPRFNYIFVRSESTDVYEAHALNLVGNTLYYYEDGTNYQFVLRDNDPGYFGTVRRFNGTQVEPAITYFKEKLPNVLWDLLPWLLF